MNGLVIALTTFSITAWLMFNFAFTSNLNESLLDARPDIFTVMSTLSIVTNIMVIMYFISFYRASVTSPGRVPDAPPWNLIDPADQAPAREVKKSGGKRYCRYDRKYKPDRTHHCSQCQECTLRMDHHCPWLDNCIGFWNYKFFLLTLFYGSLSLMLIGVSCGWLGWYIFGFTPVAGIDISRLAVGLAVGAVCALGSFVIVLFLSMHVVMAAKGLTTIEVFEKGNQGMDDDSCIRTICCTKRDPVTKKPLYPPSSYKLESFVQNLKAAMGEDILRWFIPSMPVMKTGSEDGLIFQTNEPLDASKIEESADSPLINPHDR